MAEIISDERMFEGVVRDASKWYVPCLQYIQCTHNECVNSGGNNNSSILIIRKKGRQKVFFLMGNVKKIFKTVQLKLV